jgi:hypothetical protein
MKMTCLFDKMAVPRFGTVATQIFATGSRLRVAVSRGTGLGTVFLIDVSLQWVTARTTWYGGRYGYSPRYPLPGRTVPAWYPIGAVGTVVVVARNVHL